MKRVLVLGTLVLVILLLFLTYQNSTSHLATKQITINNHQFSVEIADTDSFRNKGLSGRSFLEQNSGMLFIFPKSSYYRFWMKEMRFPLDFIWIDKNIVIDTTENVAVSNTQKGLKTFTAITPFDKVLEVNAGVVKLYNIQKGDLVK